MKTVNDKKKKRMVDMSDEAIDQRIRDLAQLFKLGMSIRSAKRLGRVKGLVTTDMKNDNRSPESQNPR